MTDKLLTFNSRSFSGQLNTTFAVEVSPNTSVALELVDVEEKPAPRNTELFMLHFRGALAPFLEQRTYSFQHEKMGKFELFITAIEKDQHGIIYEAVFHRLRKP